MPEKTTQLSLRLDIVEKALLNSKKVLTFEECLAYTGLSRSHLYRLTSLKLIPHSKPFGGRVYFDRDEIDAWLLQGKVSTSKTK